MPYKSERINIQNTAYDRRQKMSEDTKQYMRYMREEYGFSYNQLADMFGVSKSLAIFVCNPDKYEKSKQLSRERHATGRYKPTKEQWADTMRDHRRYKQSLYTSGKIHGCLSK